MSNASPPAYFSSNADRNYWLLYRALHNVLSMLEKRGYAPEPHSETFKSFESHIQLREFLESSSAPKTTIHSLRMTPYAYLNFSADPCEPLQQIRPGIGRVWVEFHDETLGGTVWDKKISKENIRALRHYLRTHGYTTGILISTAHPSSTASALRRLYPLTKPISDDPAADIYMEHWTVQELGYDPTAHVLVPKHEVLRPDEVRGLKKRYKLQRLSQLPLISAFDPVVLWLGIRGGMWSGY